MKTIKLNLKKPQKAIKHSLSVLKEGGLLVFPSDTVYILAVDATNQKAVKKLLSFKSRWTGKAISVAVSDQKMARKYTTLTPKTQNLYQNLLPGPFTIVSKGKHLLPPGIEAEDGTLGIRIPDHKPLLQLIRKLGKPVTATSANLSGRRPHYSLSAFLSPLSRKKKNLIDLLIDAGKLPQNLPSTVIDVTQKEIKVLRRGDLVNFSSYSFISSSPSQTQKIAQFIFRKSLKTHTKRAPPKPLVFCLAGDLGVGKTVFTQGIGKILDLDHLPSPTFNIINEYQINYQNYKSFHHLDLYRLEKPYEYEEINFLSHFMKNTISCIEWAENLGPYFKKLQKITSLVTVRLEHINQKTRKISYQIS